MRLSFTAEGRMFPDKLPARMDRLLSAIFKLERGIDRDQIDIVVLLQRLEKQRPWAVCKLRNYDEFMRRSGIRMEPEHYRRAKLFIGLFGRRRAAEVGMPAVIQVCRLESLEDKNRLLDKIFVFRRKHGRIPGPSKLLFLLREVDPSATNEGKVSCSEVEKLRRQVRERDKELALRDKIVRDKNKQLLDDRNTIAALRVALRKAKATIEKLKAKLEKVKALARK